MIRGRKFKKRQEGAGELMIATRGGSKDEEVSKNNHNTVRQYKGRIWQCPTPHRTTPHRTAPHHTTLHHSTAQHSTTRHHYTTPQHSTVQHRERTLLSCHQDF